ncbi:glycosyltransferase [Ectothiorhodospira lacustris]|uniref:glycosyltransferase n=1 Tax=Ectothiorhodospira lacustris TaxID=2899127 RepID=UPI001EE8BB18|nr:nucleotide disphospho-sugar-binding domain-containing protein [Ectothiorhodospira lacustris]MCG5510850.1 hypothetical protein [Ectothiorhodospira lacustris]MCG5522604.1 hypothetical protein [Ectothiorhodospira lacustris]
MKILALPNAHALAHVSRLLEVAKILQKRGHEILFAGQGKYLQLVERDGFEFKELPYISAERIVQAVRTQRLWELYKEKELEGFMNAERSLYHAYKPELVLIDNRPTARTSAEKAGIPSIAILNTHMSNYRSIPFFSYRQWSGRENSILWETADAVENIIEKIIYDRIVMGGLNRIRKRYGLSTLFAYEHEAGSHLSLLADIPQFNPAKKLPADYHFIGPLTWRNTLPAPTCLEQMDPERPVVYLSLGSEGLIDLVNKLETLTRDGIQFIIAGGGADLDERHALPGGVYLEKYVNTEKLLPYCNLVCCHGGNGTLYQALSHGLPCVVVSTHAEQNYGGKRVHQLGLGQNLTLKQVKKSGPEILLQAISDTLESNEQRNSALKFSKHIQEWDAPSLAADTIEKLDF